VRLDTDVNAERLLWAPQAWLPGGWQAQVLLEIDTSGHWRQIQAGIAEPPSQATRLPGPVLPGLVNAHSHAFQRAFAGMAERREGTQDDFWSWRERMYQVALCVTPELLRDIAAQLYVELLRGGYTQVCEFHYLQHDEQGRPYADPLALSWALADAAEQAGIGLTLLPVLYERAGFQQPALRDEQRRFANTADAVWAAQQVLAGSGRPLLNAGLAVHSLRAAAPASLLRLRELATGFGGPIHMHVAEQQQEVDDCLAATGARPIEWLLRERLLDARWQLVHATHTTPAEIDGIAASGAGVVLCPSTEANLGDGLADLPGWLAAGVPLALGSDSQVTRCWREELRLLEYGQRLARRQRNVAAAPGRPSSAERLFAGVQGGHPAGFSCWGLQAGARADLLVADEDDPALAGVPMPQWLDALVFSSPGRLWRDVMVAGRWVLRSRCHAGEARTAPRLAAALRTLWCA
jgi:formimidoylglutamate deiminase